MWQCSSLCCWRYRRRQPLRDISTAASATPTGHPILALGSPAPDFFSSRRRWKDPHARRTTRLPDFWSSSSPAITARSRKCMSSHSAVGATTGLRGSPSWRSSPTIPRRFESMNWTPPTSSDSLDEMKIRFEYKHLLYPYLYDGETQSARGLWSAGYAPRLHLRQRPQTTLRRPDG